MKTKTILASLTVLSIAVLFQNCGSPVHFNAAAPALFAADTTSGGPGTSGVTDGVTPTGGPSTSSVTDGVTPTYSPTPTSGDGTMSGGSSPGKSTDLVECDLGSPNIKVGYSAQFSATSSNGSDTRVCMSQTACLSLINAYATVRGCTLKSGPSTTSSQGQCTQIFPGKGVCNSANVLTDAQIAGLLSAMAATK